MLVNEGTSHLELILWQDFAMGLVDMLPERLERTLPRPVPTYHSQKTRFSKLGGVPLQKRDEQREYRHVRPIVVDPD